jgi:hypothetical protein
MTEKMQAYSIEEGDTIILKGNSYVVLTIMDGTLADYKFRIMDDMGDIHTFECDLNDEIRVVCDPYMEEVDA